MKKVFALVLSILMVSTIFYGCSKSADNAQSGDSPKLIEEGKLYVGLDDTYPPMEYVNEETGEREGFDVDLAKALGEKLGLEVEFVSSAWDSIFTGLDAGKYDTVISSVSITEERYENMELSNPYLANGQVIVINPKDTSIKKLDDLQGKKVGVQLETTADIACKKTLETIDFDLTQYDQVDQAFLAMESGNVDCIVADMAVGIGYAKKKPDKFLISSVSLTNEPIAVAIKKGNKDLLNDINECIKAFQEDGTMAKISKKYLGKDYTQNIDTKINTIQ